MFLWWGNDCVQFYNDAYRSSLGQSSKHPAALGQRGADCWQETWPTIKPLIDQIFAGGEATWNEDQLIPIYSNGRLEDVYWTSSYSPVYDETGKPAGALVVCSETTEKVRNIAQLAASKDELLFAVEATELGTWDLNPMTGEFQANARLKKWFGLSTQEAVTLSLALDAIADQDRQRVTDAIQHSLRYESGGQYSIDYTIIHPASQQERIVRAKGRAWFNNEHVAYRFNGTLQDITGERKAQDEKQRAQWIAELATENAGIGIFQVDTATGQTDYNPVFAYIMTGRANTKRLNREQFVRYIHPDDEPLRAATLQTIFEKGEFEYEPRVIWADGTVHRIQIRGKMIYNGDNQPVAYSGIARDVTEQRSQARALVESEAKFRSLIEEAPVGTCLFVGRKLTIEVANEIMIRYWGKDRSAIGRPLAEAIPELEGQPFLGILDSIFTTGETYEAKSAPAKLEVNGVLSTYYFDYTFKPLFDANGDVYAIMDMAVDVTDQVLARRELEESELFSRSVIENSPIAKVVFAGEDMIIKTVNQNMLAMLGRDAAIIGMPFMDAVPELRATPLLERLRHVLTTGETYHQPEEKIELVRHGQPYTGYYNYIYKALEKTTGERYGVIVTATEITEQVVARKKVEEAEATLRGAIELAELGTWQIDLTTRLLDYSPRLRQWCGISQNEVITVERAYFTIRQADHERVRAAIFQAIAPGSDGLYDVEYTLDANHSGKERILRAQGLAFFNDQGQAYKISGTVQDVTDQRRMQAALEQQVQERTEALEATNEELAATNEELAVTNDELADSVRDLQRSNENLQQFAYIASHDLQEPLRKIQSFGDLLKTQYGEQLSEGVDYLQRMQSAANRMSTLIKDLLIFSRISTRQETATAVALNRVIQSVLNDLDLTIQETGATIQIDPLPTVQGNSIQLGQLFQNLLSNALKFRRADVVPVIQITVHTMAVKSLPLSVNPSRLTAFYHCIAVRDNGIGFDQKYTDRIFQVFQRLHNKSQYAGTGIGLAICEKVAANHGGAIIATSQVGQGATFSVYLPI